MHDENEIISEQHDVWEEWAQADAMMAIATDTSKSHGRWNPEEFYATGVEDVDGVMSDLTARGIEFPHDRSLDFGCGVGRLTQALAHHFRRADGVDISETMVDLARKYNRHGASCQYHVNEAANLSIFDDGAFDFIYSTIVLQHNPSDLAVKYIEEFVRILSVDGVALFDMTTEPRAERLSDGSERASLEMNPPLRMDPAKPLTFPVRVENSSSFDWPADSLLKVGNHWWQPGTDKPVAFDDGRASLEDGLASGAVAEVPLTVVPPPLPGTYILEVDVVSEGQCWFADRGSSTVTRPIEVRPPLWRRLRYALRRDSVVDSTIEPEPASRPTAFGMHGLSRERVVAAVKRSGGHVLLTETSDRGGSWAGFRYYVSKNVSSSA